MRALQDASDTGQADSATPSATVSQLAHYLKLDKGTVSRRVKVALDAGYLVNNETRKGRAYQLRTGDALPDEVEVLPSGERLTEALGGCCSVADETEGYTPPPPAAANGNGYHPEWEWRYLQLKADGMPDQDALYQAMREQEVR